MIKNKLLKIIVALCLVIIVTQQFFPCMIYATSITPEQSQKFTDILDYGGLGNLVDGIVGIMTIGSRIKWTLVGTAIGAISTVIAVSDNIGDLADAKWVTPEDILFNRITITDIDFFDVNGAPAGSVTRTIREQVSLWYTVLRDVAVVILLCVLIYIGIRMAMSTVAADKAEYKKMLINWAVSFVLLFLLQYIAIFAIEINKGLVNILESSIGSTADDAADPGFSMAGVQLTGPRLFESYILDLATRAINPLSATEGWAAVIVYVAVGLLTIAFLYQYVMRMLTIAFLILISPLITITYSIDKVGDNKSQALNTWMKQLIYTILLQPFHCIIYLAFVSTAIESLTTSGLAGLVIAVLCMTFILQAENIVRTIFAFQTSKSVIATAAGLTVAQSALRMGRNGITRISSTMRQGVANTASGAGNFGSSGGSTSGGSAGSGGGGAANMSSLMGNRNASNNMATMFTAAALSSGGGGSTPAANTGGASQQPNSNSGTTPMPNNNNNNNDNNNNNNNNNINQSSLFDKYMKSQKNQFGKSKSVGAVDAVASLMQGRLPGMSGTGSNMKKANAKYGNSNLNASDIANRLSVATGKNYDLDNEDGKQNFEQLAADIRRTPQAFVDGFMQNMERVRGNYEARYEGMPDAAQRADNDLENTLNTMNNMTPDQISSLDQDERDLYESLMYINLAGLVENGEIGDSNNVTADMNTIDPNSPNYQFERTLADINSRRNNSNSESAQTAQTSTTSSVNRSSEVNRNTNIENTSNTANLSGMEKEKNELSNSLTGSLKDADQSAKGVENASDNIERLSKNAERSVGDIEKTARDIENIARNFEKDAKDSIAKMSAGSGKIDTNNSTSANNPTVKRSEYKLKQNTGTLKSKGSKTDNSEKIRRSMQIDQEAKKQYHQTTGTSNSGVTKGNIKTKNNTMTPPNKGKKV